MNPVYRQVMDALFTKHAENDLETSLVDATPVGIENNGIHYEFRETALNGDPWFTLDVIRPVVPERAGMG